MTETETEAGSFDRIDDFRMSGLRLHNFYRNKHGVEGLVLDENLNKLAQDYALKMAKTGNFNHGENAKNYGENLYYQCHSKKHINLNSKKILLKNINIQFYNCLN